MTKSGLAWENRINQALNRIKSNTKINDERDRENDQIKKAKLFTI